MNQHIPSNRSRKRDAQHQNLVHKRLRDLNISTIEAMRASQNPHMQKIIHGLYPREGGLMDAIIAHADTGVNAPLLAQHVAIQSGLAIAELVGCCGLNSAMDNHTALKGFLEALEHTAKRRLLEIT